MEKTTNQRLLEMQRGMPIEDVLRAALESHRGEKYLMSRVAHDLDLSTETCRRWCESLNIAIADYR